MQFTTDFIRYTFEYTVLKLHRTSAKTRIYKLQYFAWNKNESKLRNHTYRWIQRSGPNLEITPFPSITRFTINRLIIKSLCKHFARNEKNVFNNYKEEFSFF